MVTKGQIFKETLFPLGMEMSAVHWVDSVVLPGARYLKWWRRLDSHWASLNSSSNFGCWGFLFCFVCKNCSKGAVGSSALLKGCGHQLTDRKWNLEVFEHADPQKWSLGSFPFAGLQWLSQPPEAQCPQGCQPASQSPNKDKWWE